MVILTVVNLPFCTDDANHTILFTIFVFMSGGEEGSLFSSPGTMCLVFM